jgi:hypothetical protein
LKFTISPFSSLMPPNRLMRTPAFSVRLGITRQSSWM